MCNIGCFASAGYIRRWWPSSRHTISAPFRYVHHRTDGSGWVSRVGYSATFTVNPSTCSILAINPSTSRILAKARLFCAGLERGIYARNAQLCTKNVDAVQRVLLKNGRVFLEQFLRVALPFFEKNFRGHKVRVCTETQRFVCLSRAQLCSISMIVNARNISLYSKRLRAFS
jgi:hypothetical protein